ncbi:MAG: NAD-dependent formate dehydrogenase iron-sulfur protein [Firmicutes bacterium]|nr:NAD-dependent formate dehydrogenase iron-sulfur protein [Bacillota bacterium]
MPEPVVRLTIDGQAVAVPPGATIREAATSLGIQTPTLCYHDRLNCGSNCRACVVELAGARVLVPACSRPVAEGMQVHTDSDRVRLSRRMVLELLMTETDTSAAPELAAYARHYGAHPERYPGVVAAATSGREPIRDNPFFIRDYAKCIACQRCVQACGVDIQHTFAIAMVGHGHLVSVGAGDGGNDLTGSSCVFCGNCVGVCPTGALMGLAEYDARQAGEFPTPRVTWSPAAGFSEEVD